MHFSPSSLYPSYFPNLNILSSPGPPNAHSSFNAQSKNNHFICEVSQVPRVGHHPFRVIIHFCTYLYILTWLLIWPPRGREHTASKFPFPKLILAFALIHSHAPEIHYPMNEYKNVSHWQTNVSSGFCPTVNANNSPSEAPKLWPRRKISRVEISSYWNADLPFTLV